MAQPPQNYLTLKDISPPFKTVSTVVLGTIFPLRSSCANGLTNLCSITRFKGLGEISPDEFKHFIGEDIRLDPVKIDANESIKEMLKFFMGKNTPIRQEYIIRNLRFEHDLVDEDEAESNDAEQTDSSGDKGVIVKEKVAETAAA